MDFEGSPAHRPRRSKTGLHSGAPGSSRSCHRLVLCAGGRGVPCECRSPARFYIPENLQTSSLCCDVTFHKVKAPFIHVEHDVQAKGHTTGEMTEHNLKQFFPGQKYTYRTPGPEALLPSSYNVLVRAIWTTVEELNKVLEFFCI